MADLVPQDFEVPLRLATPRFRLEPLGPQHNRADHAAWMSSIEHILATPGFEGSDWPPPSGMSLDENLADLQRHGDDFTQRRGFTYTVLEPGSDDVIGCVYIYPSKREGYDVDVESWVRADRAELDGPLSAAVSTWLAADWPFESINQQVR